MSDIIVTLVVLWLVWKAVFAILFTCSRLANEYRWFPAIGWGIVSAAAVYIYATCEAPTPTVAVIGHLLMAYSILFFLVSLLAA